jgi:hypothetical protein
MRAIASGDKRYYRIEAHIEKISGDKLLAETLDVVRRDCCVIDSSDDNSRLGGFRDQFVREAIKHIRHHGG